LKSVEERGILLKWNFRQWKMPLVLWFTEMTGTAKITDGFNREGLLEHYRQKIDGSVLLADEIN